MRELAALVASKVYYRIDFYEAASTTLWAPATCLNFDVSTNEILSYAIGVVMGLIQNRTYRGELLRELATPD